MTRQTTPREVLSVEDYVAELATQVTTLEVESVPLRAAVGRVLASDAVARTSVPAFRNSAMDGYAVRWGDIAQASEQTPVTLDVVADLPAGSGADPLLPQSSCARIMTGAPVPTAADTIVPVELTDGGEHTVTLTGRPSGEGAHVRDAGEDLRAGDLVAAAGTRLDASALAALAATGVGQVEVRRRPRVAVGATGDELRPADADLARGEIHESNAVFLTHALAALGCTVTDLGVIADDVDAFTRAVRGAAATHDLVVLTGGASVGTHDVARIVLSQEGRSAYRHVRMQPGKPQGWAVLDDALVVSLPGNPVSASVSLHVLVAPLVEHLLGMRDATTPSGAVARGFTCLAEVGWSSPGGRRQYLPAVLTHDGGGRARVRPAHVRGSGSHLTSSLVSADALVVVPEETTEVHPGDRLIALPLKEIRS